MACFFGRVDLEQPDILAGLYLANAMQRQQWRAAVLARLHAAGVPLAPALEAEARQQQQEDEAESYAGAGRLAGRPGDLGAVEPSSRNSQADASDPPDVSIAVDDSEEAFWAWLRSICEPPALLLAPPGVAAELAPQLRCVWVCMFVEWVGGCAGG